ncbi:hypothetical protein KP509_09G096400 [Ceratopteris richardii]|uniref:Uncharacterized protein n=1 Tax=Ceratopteris richardii TaxID=49495 RepID=A0A8T2U4Y0_CERRI|nr:hypothetical protein KP509_09G096400 [Ceratopteris richardii]
MIDGFRIGGVERKKGNVSMEESLNGRAVDQRYEALAEIDGSSEVLKLKMDAMTLAVMSKDAEIAALQAAVREGRERERSLQMEMAALQSRLENAVIAEERLAAQIAELEAEAFQRARSHKVQFDKLQIELHNKEKKLDEALGQLSLFGGNAAAKAEASRATPRSSPSRYPRSPIRVPQNAVVKLAASWWPWAQKLRSSSAAATRHTMPKRFLPAMSSPATSP